MAKAVYYDSETGWVTFYDPSANTPMAQKAGALINPNLEEVSGVPVKQWKVINGRVVNGGNQKQTIKQKISEVVDNLTHPVVPEMIIKNYKERIAELLPEEDKQVLEAFINMQVAQRTAQINLVSQVFKGIGSFLSKLIILLVIGLMAATFFGGSKNQEYE